MYDQFTADYDRFVNWEGRLAMELPFLEAQLRTLEKAGRQPVRVLDAACGTGRHVLALKERGFEAAGVDLSVGMVQRARDNAIQAGIDARFEVAGFGELVKMFGGESFNALLCLGNSLPHVLSGKELAGVLADFAACLRPGGLVVIQNRNFDAVMARRERWMEPQSHRAGGREWLFLRFYDFDPVGLITFHVVILKREQGGEWTQSEMTTHLRPLLQVELQQRLEESGFFEIRFYGNLTGAPFELESSGNLVITARRK